MTVTEILKELESSTEHFPKEAMEAAIEQREAITPELLAIAGLSQNRGDKDQAFHRRGLIC